MSKPKIACVVGTRPDAIKMAPVIREFKKHSDVVDVLTVSTGQHREMLDQALGAFDLVADEDLGVMSHGQSLAELTSKALVGLDHVFSKHKPNYVIAQGDTTTTFVAGLTAFYHGIRFGHVEAGLRTDSITNPFPEEFNRRACGLVADLHFPPTKGADQNLEREHIPDSNRLITGNTGIDAVQYIAERCEEVWYPEHSGPVVLLTTHRRENWGEPQRNIARAALKLVNEFSDVLLVVPMHKNPSVRELLKGVLGNHPQVRLIEPPDYAPFVKLLQRSTFALTDSGGVQEEAPSFGIPVLVLRDTTERPEGVESGAAKLVGTQFEVIYSEASKLLKEPAVFESMSKAQNPYGDGQASARIVAAVLDRVGVATERVAAWA